MPWEVEKKESEAKRGRKKPTPAADFFPPSVPPLFSLSPSYRYRCFFVTSLSNTDKCVSLGSVASASKSARFRSALLESTSIDKFGTNCSKLCPMRETLLLESSSVPSRGRRGKPSRVRTPLSERSIESNWFCFFFYIIFEVKEAEVDSGGGGERTKGKRRSTTKKKKNKSFSVLLQFQHEPLSRRGSRSLLSCSLCVDGFEKIGEKDGETRSLKNVC